MPAKEDKGNAILATENVLLYSASIGREKYWRIGRIDCHLPMFYLPVFSLPVIYSIGTTLILVPELWLLSCCYNKTW